MTTLPRISVVVPSFQQGRFLRQALSSLFDQRYPGLEVVVMDGGSTDESTSVIREYADRLAHWQSRPDGGQAAAINEGVRRTTGDLVGWLNADDFHWQDALWVVARAYLRNPGAGLYVGNGFRHVEATGKRRRFCPGHVAFHRRALAEGLDYVLQPATFVLRRAWEAVGGLDERLHYGLDWDLFLRVARDHPAVTINEFLAASREHGDTKTALGGLRRAAELVQVVHERTERRITPGTAYYILHALRAAAAAELPAAVAANVDATMHGLQESMRARWGGNGMFPDRSDAQDTADVPVGTPLGVAAEPAPPPGALRISVVLVAHGADPGPALDSVLAQGLPHLDIVVVHTGDEAIRAALATRGAGVRGVTLPGDWTFARALQAGLEAATGDVATWLDSGDRLAERALVRVGMAFSDTPDLDEVAGHGMYVDSRQQADFVTSGGMRIGVRFAGDGPPAAVPWPSRRSRVFVRRRAMETARAAAGSHGQGFWRALAVHLAQRQKAVIERILWIYPVGSEAEADEPVFLPGPVADERARPTRLERWVAALPRHGAVRRLGRAVVRRVRR